MFELQRVRRVRSVLHFVRERVPHYGPLVTDDLHHFRDELVKATVGAGVSAVAGLITELIAAQEYWIDANGTVLDRSPRWMRAGFRLPILVAPLVIKMLLNRNRRKPALQTMRPGVTLDTRRTPEPLLPYDKIRTLRSPEWNKAR